MDEGTNLHVGPSEIFNYTFFNDSCVSEVIRNNANVGHLKMYKQCPIFVYFPERPYSSDTAHMATFAVLKHPVTISTQTPLTPKI